METKEGLIFDVKGLLHPEDRKICYVRFRPDPDGDRVREGRRYSKIYDLNERFKFLKAHHPEYVFYSDRFNMEMQGVPTGDIREIYHPRDYRRKLMELEPKSRLERCSLELCELFIDQGKLPEDSIGITGSPMVGLNKQVSDIDLVIYGTDESLQFQDRLSDILCSGQFCRKYNEQEYHTHYEWRAGGSDIPFDEFLLREKRKLHQGMFKGFEFFIRYLKSPEDWGGTYQDYFYENLGRITVKATINDATDAIFTPCAYKIDVSKILEGPEGIEEDSSSEIKEVNSFRGRFCEHAVEGETVLIEGKLEKVTVKNSEQYHRILLRDQRLDRMVSFERE